MRGVHAGGGRSTRYLNPHLRGVTTLVEGRSTRYLNPHLRGAEYAGGGGPPPDLESPLARGDGISRPCSRLATKYPAVAGTSPGIIISDLNGRGRGCLEQRMIQENRQGLPQLRPGSRTGMDYRRADRPMIRRLRFVPWPQARG